MCKDGTYSPSCRCNNSDNVNDHENLTNEYVNDNKKTINTSKYSEDNESNHIFSLLYSILVGGITYFILIKMKYRPQKIKNKAIKKINNILYILIVCFLGWITIPLILGSEGYYIMEIISIILIALISYNSSDNDK